ncbi:alpha/beta hydrolase [Pseudorhizobium pelagicum]|uniref:alpha/beta hydrolase n=1 Tax=Pseudorhizobium pelagicum TaxID=1509405 RepID=UPI00055BE2FC|nr:alpha/beta hydrolase [Pseudorhizobium pelagicum]
MNPNIPPSNQNEPAKAASVILVHGAFVDASGWRPVYEILSRNGYEVLIVQNPTVTLQGDVDAVRHAVAKALNPVVLVGHSYGGAVITEAGNHGDVRALVYLAAFVPEAGESVFDLASHEVPGAEPAPLLPPADGFIRVDPAKFPKAFAADVDPAQTRFMAAAQVPWGLEAVQGKISTPAWREKPSYFLLATEDKMIPAEAQAMMAKRANAKITEIKSSHAVMMSRPEEVAAMIETAANSPL